MKESVFANEIKNSCQDKCFYYKIPDSYGNQRFTPLKPFDSFILYKGNFIAMEFKMHKKTSAWPFDSVKEHQIEGLLKIFNENGMAWVILNIRRPFVNIVKAITISDFIELKQKYSDNNKKSIPLSEIDSCNKFINIPRDYSTKGKILYNINIILETSIFLAKI